VFIDFRLARCAENSKPDDSSFDWTTFLSGFFVQRQQTTRGFSRTGEAKIK
jgi:hypothetical protein